MNIKPFIVPKSDDWATPKVLYKELNKEFKFNFDPCPLNSDFDGLKIKWGSRVFINPPYSNIKKFLEYGLQQNCEILVYLLPVRTSTKWFQEIILPYHNEIRFINKRLHFNEHKNCAFFDSMVVVFK